MGLKIIVDQVPGIKIIAEVNKNIFTTPWISLSSKNILFFDSNAFKQETAERFPNIKQTNVRIELRREA